MVKKYIIAIIILVVSIFLTLFFYMITSNEIIRTLFGNTCVGLFTGFFVLIITNLKNSFIYQNNVKIKELREIIDNSRDYEIKILNFKGMSEVPVIELIYIYADLNNLFTDIKKYNCELYNKYDFSCEELINSCNEKVGELSEVMSEVNVSNKFYDKSFDGDLSSKMIKVFTLRRDLQIDLKNIEKETEKLYKSIF